VEGSASPNKAYFLPFQNAIIRVCEYAPVGGKAHFFFGLDRLFYGYASVLFEQIASSPRRGEGYEWKERLGTLTYPKAKETPQVQIPDVLANLTYHHMLDAGKLLGTVAPSPLLAKWISNRKTDTISSSTRGITLRWLLTWPGNYLGLAHTPRWLSV
jgi:hypothetical protein